MQTAKYLRVSVSANDQNLTMSIVISFDWMVLTLGFKIHLDHKSKEMFQRVPECKCTRKETVDKDILIKSWFSDRKVMQPIRTTSDKMELFRENKEFESNPILHFFTNC